MNPKLFEIEKCEKFYLLFFILIKLFPFSYLQKAELTQCDTINVQLIRSANQLIYEYYHDITAAELKAYALVQLAYMFYTVYGRGAYFCLKIVK